MVITTKFFAAFRDIIGADSLDLNVDQQHVTVNTIIRQLEQQHPAFEGRLTKIALIAVNEVYAQHQQELQPEDVVAFFPPVSGG